jgi:hypothetical protein
MTKGLTHTLRNMRETNLSAKNLKLLYLTAQKYELLLAIAVGARQKVFL